MSCKTAAFAALFNESLVLALHDNPATITYLKIIMRKHLENIKGMTHWSVPMRRSVPMRCQCLGNGQGESRLQYWPNFCGINQKPGLIFHANMLVL